MELVDNKKLFVNYFSNLLSFTLKIASVDKYSIAEGMIQKN